MDLIDNRKPQKDSTTRDPDYSALGKDDVLEKVRHSKSAYFLLSDEMKSIREIALTAIKSYPNIFTDLDKSFKQNKAFVLDFLKELPTEDDRNSWNYKKDSYSINPDVIISIPLNLLNDKDVLLEALRVCPRFTEFAKDGFNIPPDIAKKDVFNNPRHFALLPKIFRSNPDICITALEKDPSLLLYVAEELRDDSQNFLNRLYQTNIPSYFHVRKTQQDKVVKEQSFNWSPPLKDTSSAAFGWSPSSELIAAQDLGNKEFYLKQANLAFIKDPESSRNPAIDDALRHIFERMDSADLYKVEDPNSDSTLTDILAEYKIRKIKKVSVSTKEKILRRSIKP